MFPITYASSGLSGPVVHFESQNQEVSETTPTWHLWRIKESMAAGRVRAAEPLHRVRVRAAEPLGRVRAAENEQNTEVKATR